ncbi:MAG: hypothetical protein FWG48_05435 [Oscillospiraceae bacterium]|nr:hypothetical protein [Oscillospiraceae bacterium]
MIKIIIVDTTLNESEQANAAKLSFREKLEAAKLLEKMQVDVIETSPVGETPADAAFVRTLATTITSCVISVPLPPDKQSADRVWSTLSKAKKPRLNVTAPVSTVQMEYIGGAKAETMLPMVRDAVAYCAALCSDVEFTAEDATRAEPEFLAAVLEEVIKAGAKTICLCDTVGEMLPGEMAQFISSVYDAAPQLKSVTLSLHCRDNLGLASAAALAGIGVGVRQIKASSGGSAGTLRLEEFLNVIKIRGETLGISYNINDTALRRIGAQLRALSGAGGASPERGFAEPAGEPVEVETLRKDADAGALRNHIAKLGYDVSPGDLDVIYAQFKEIARSKNVVNRDIEALVAENAGQAAATYRLISYVINSGSAIAATAYVEIAKGNDVRNALSSGDGPIDAAFRATEQIIGALYELEEFQIQAVTGGREATGDALVKLRHAGKLYSGRGVSTDIIGASIRAYLSAVNKIVYEEL